jgi:hypothetical protein
MLNYIGCPYPFNGKESRFCLHTTDQLSNLDIECSDILGPKPKVLSQVIAFKGLHTGFWLGCKISFPLLKDQVRTRTRDLVSAITL